MLTAARLREVLHYEPETGVFTRIKSVCGQTAGTICGSPNGRGYIQITIDGKSYLAHRLAFLYMTGEWPAEFADHINCTQTDNRWANLREATKYENARNSRGRRDTIGGLKGARYDKSIDKYRASIAVNGKQKYLGVFITAEEASQAYSLAAKQYYGQFARGA